MPPERSAMLARFPHVKAGPDKAQCHRQAVSGHRLRDGDDVRNYSGFFEGEIWPGATAARLDLVDYEKDAMTLRHGAYIAQAFLRRKVNAALDLNRLHDDGRWDADPGEGIFQQSLQVGHGVE